MQDLIIRLERSATEKTAESTRAQHRLPRIRAPAASQTEVNDGNDAFKSAPYGDNPAPTHLSLSSNANDLPPRSWKRCYLQGAEVSNSGGMIRPLGPAAYCWARLRHRPGCPQRIPDGRGFTARPRCSSAGTPFARVESTTAVNVRGPGSLSPRPRSSSGTRPRRSRSGRRRP